MPDYGDDFEMIAAEQDVFEFDADDVAAFESANAASNINYATKPKEENE